MKQLLCIVAAMLSGAAISACSVKASGGGDTPAIVEPKGVKGPDLSGTWSSGCQHSNFGEYKTFDVVYTTATVSRKSATYNDANCTSVIDSRTQDGTYKFVQANKDGSFNVEYKIPIGNGMSALPQEKVLLDNGVLYLSDYALGDAITKDLMVALHRVPAQPASHQ